MAGADKTAAAVKELIDLLGRLDERFTTGDRGLTDEASLLEGYRWIFSILQVGTDVFLWGDTNRPRFVDIVGPYRKWGGDNADAYYQFAPINPAKTYRVRGRKGDAVYFSLTVYGGPDDGHYSTRIVGTVNDRMIDVGDDGSFEIILSPREHPGAWLRLEDDAVAAITRDYLVEPTTGRRVEWTIECLDGDDDTAAPDDDELARRFRAVTTWVEEQAAIAPVVLATTNEIEEPYPVPQATFGWAAGDAAYAMGSFELEPDEALVIRGRSPECAFWNLCLWNPFLHTYNYDYDRVTINGGQVAYEPDGSWEIVVAGRHPDRPNWVSTQAHRTGLIWLRWFHPTATPERPTTEVIRISRPAPGTPAA
jgi:hypothetical protein